MVAVAGLKPRSQNESVVNQLPAPLIVCRITGSLFRYLVKAEPPMFAICAATDDGAVTATHNGPPPANKSIS